MIIRHETDGDLDAITLAFGRPNEGELVEQIRESERTFGSWLSLRR